MQVCTILPLYFLIAYSGKLLIQTAVIVLILQSSPYWFTAPCMQGPLWSTVQVFMCISYYIPHIYYNYIYHLMVILVLKSIKLKKSWNPSIKQNYSPSPHGDREEGQGSSSQKDPRGYHYPVLCVSVSADWNWKGRRLCQFAVHVAEHVHSCMRGGFSLFGPGPKKVSIFRAHPLQWPL